MHFSPESRAEFFRTIEPPVRTYTPAVLLITLLTAGVVCYLHTAKAALVMSLAGLAILIAIMTQIPKIYPDVQADASLSPEVFLNRIGQCVLTYPLLLVFCTMIGGWVCLVNWLLFTVFVLYGLLF